MAELKPCPFCGVNVVVAKKKYIPDAYKIVGNHKDNCAFAKMLWAGGYHSEEEAAEAWNRRYDQKWRLRS